MSGFLTELRLQKSGTRLWDLTDDLLYYSDKYRGYFRVPSGTRTNLASIPRLFWTIFPPVDKYDPAAVIHDAGYNNNIQTIMGHRVFTVKEVADNIFYEAMISLGVGQDRAETMYEIVKLFGKPDGQVIDVSAQNHVVVSSSISGHNINFDSAILLC